MPAATSELLTVLDMLQSEPTATGIVKRLVERAIEVWKLDHEVYRHVHAENSELRAQLALTETALAHKGYELREAQQTIERQARAIDQRHPDIRGFQ